MIMTRRKFISFVLCLCMVFSVLSASALAVSAATSGKTDDSIYCTVKIDQSLINKPGKQYATVKFKTYDMTGWWNTGAKVQITLRDGKDNYICSWVAKGGDTFKLGDDHSTYRIYVDYYENTSSNFIEAANNFTNLGSAYQWTITNAKKCSIS